MRARVLVKRVDGSEFWTVELVVPAGTMAISTLLR